MDASDPSAATQPGGQRAGAVVRLSGEINRIRNKFFASLQKTHSRGFIWAREEFPIAASLSL